MSQDPSKLQEIDLDLDSLIDDSSAPSGPTPLKVMGFVVPDGARRIQVVDDKGNLKWRRLNEVRPDDAPSLDSAGKPVFMHGEIGRPTKVELHDVMAPATPKVGDLIKVKAAQMRADPMVQMVLATPDNPDILDLASRALAEEISSLRFERMEAERQGQDTSQLSMRRVQAIKALVETFFKKKEQVRGVALDLASPEFKAVLTFIGETFATALQEAGVGPEQTQSIFDLFVKRIEDGAWNTEATSRMKDAQ